MYLTTTLSPLARLSVVPAAQPVQRKGQLANTRLFAIQCYHSATRLVGFDERRGLLVDKNV
ncbi:hypothetical protein OVY01_20660 [Robbsia sp. Bb-Pol-6]|uniref:Uncharacterized protein n=1 Tax=Robbsia betulipollinis TaxID=2981849 RepID=A0ABT3ZSN0_9BURK|nr:hypothetical protein [Robbsia betulipollinis]MCY0389561.1 hypothetical protein [Robbsia betulipollinis]